LDDVVLEGLYVRLEDLRLGLSQSRRRSVEAAVEVLRLLSRREAAVEMLRLLLRCGGCCQGVKAVVEVLRLLPRCEAAV
jgi:hypothetical protein